MLQTVGLTGYIGLDCPVTNYLTHRLSG